MKERLALTKLAKIDEQSFEWWAKRNGRGALRIKRTFDLLPTQYQRCFLRLTKRLPPKEAMKKTLLLKHVIGLTDGAGFRFATSNGLHCTVKKVENTRMAEQFVAEEVESRACGQRKWRCSIENYVRLRMCPGTYVLSFKMRKQEPFGAIYWLTCLENRPLLRLLTIIDGAKTGKLTNDCLTATFHGRTIFPSDALQSPIVLEAVKRGVPPTVCALLHTDDPGQKP
jgi:hypothetical protein